MAQRAVSEETLTCPICLEILKDPVTLSCGHSYCRDCIQTHWNRKVRYSCPQCRQCFTPRPVLAKNTVLANLVEELKIAAPPADHCHTGPGDVSCDMCTGRKLKAVRSCLQCLVSYCETHLQPHRDVAVLQRHQLVAPSDKLQANLCSEHNEVKKVLCRTDQQLLCMVCRMDQHKGHDTVSSAAERAQRQKQLGAKRALLQQDLQDKETEQKKLQQEAQDISHSAQAAVQQSGDSFRELVLFLEKRCSEVEQQIRSQEEIQLRQVQKLQDKLQQDITELKRTISELDTLSLTPDHNQFILLCPSLSTDTKKTKSRVQTSSRGDFVNLVRALSVLTDDLKRSLKRFQMFDREPITRPDFISFACDIRLDPNSAQETLSLSDGNRRATLTDRKQSCEYHPDRFVEWYEVLSKENLVGRCYWEVEWSGKKSFCIAVSYRDVKRTGTVNECGFGLNDKSWALFCCNGRYSFYFNAVKSKVSGPHSGRIGIYLDHSAGTLSFYSVRDQTMSLLHKVQTTFTQPLFAGIWLFSCTDTAHFLDLR